MSETFEEYETIKNYAAQGQGYTFMKNELKILAVDATLRDFVANILGARALFLLEDDDRCEYAIPTDYASKAATLLQAQGLRVSVIEPEPMEWLDCDGSFCSVVHRLNDRWLVYIQD